MHTLFPSLDLRRVLAVVGLLFGLLPYINSIRLPPTSQFWPEWVAALLAIAVVATAALVAARSPTGQDRQVPPMASLSALAILLLLLLQLLRRQPAFTGQALIAAFELLLALALCMAGAMLRRTGHWTPLLDGIAVGLVAAMGLNAAAVAVELTGHQIFLMRVVPRVPGLRATGLFGQSNQLAVFAAIAWAASFYLWLRGRLPAALQLIASLLLALIGAAAASRAGLMIAAVMALLAWVASRDRTPAKFSIGLLTAAVAIYGVVGYAYVQAGINTASGVNTTVVRGDSVGRIELLRDGMALVRLHPWSGVGFGNFSGARWEELSGSMFESATTHSHNLVVQLAAEFGVLGALLALVPLAWAAWGCLRQALRRGAEPEQFLGAAVVAAILLYSLVEFPLWYQYFLLPLSLVLGAAGPGVPSVLGWGLVLRPRLVLLFAGVALTMSALVATDYARIQRVYWDASADVEGSAEYGLMLPRQRIRDIAVLTGFGMWTDLMLSRTLDLNPAFIDQKLAIARRVMRGITYEETIARYIALLLIAGKADDAMVVWQNTARGNEIPALSQGARQDLSTLTLEMLQIFARSSPVVATFVDSLRQPQTSTPKGS